MYDDETARATLRFLISVAAELSGCDIVGGRNVGGALLYTSDDGCTPVDTAKISEALTKLREDDLPIETATLGYAELCAYFEEARMHRSLALLKSTCPTSQVEVHTTAGKRRLALLGRKLLGRTSSLDAQLPVLVADEGRLLVVFGTGPTAAPNVDSKSLTHSTSVLSATAGLAAWGATMGVDCVGKLNGLQHTASGRELHDYMLQAEFRQEAILAQLAAAIGARGDVGVVCIAGPTSSGKTTFATKLIMYLRNMGLTGVALTVDHYYLPLDRQPKYQHRQQRSDVDYDHIESMDSVLVGEHINELLEGKEVLTPVYNMKTGYRDAPKPFQLPAPVSKSLLVIEGIHALNPEFLKSVPSKRIFKVYISPLSALQLDEGTALKTTDARLLRRMCRDYNFRGHSAARTLSMWSNVRRGEGTWIFPHQDAVDFAVNSAHEYEMRVLKPLVEPLLAAVPPDDPTYAKARELLALLALFSPASVAKVPTTSLLREFIGDGAFDCH